MSLLIIIAVTLSIAKSVCLLIANLTRFMVINQATVAIVFVLLRHPEIMCFSWETVVSFPLKCFKLANFNVITVLSLGSAETYLFPHVIWRLKPTFVNCISPHFTGVLVDVKKLFLVVKGSSLLPYREHEAKIKHN